jgi:hypothetical protein
MDQERSMSNHSESPKAKRTKTVVANWKVSHGILVSNLNTPTMLERTRKRITMVRAFTHNWSGCAYLRVCVQQMVPDETNKAWQLGAKGIDLQTARVQICRS